VKLKNHSGAKKRFKISSKGKVLKKKCGARHNLGRKSKDRKLGLRKEHVLSKVLADTIKAKLPYS
jgi:large subunit ribosomal protein L35